MLPPPQYVPPSDQLSDAGLRPAGGGTLELPLRGVALNIVSTRQVLVQVNSDWPM
jgi:hypothetical protein